MLHIHACSGLYFFSCSTALQSFPSSLCWFPFSLLLESAVFSPNTVILHPFLNMFFLYLCYLKLLFIFYQLGHKLTQKFLQKLLSCYLQFKEIAADHKSTEGAKVGQLKFRYLNVSSSECMLHNFLTVT